MTDYYIELGLDRSKNTDEINVKLNHLESIWKRREITSPEKATTMLALIIQARKVFASDTLRRQYDSDLRSNNEKPIETNPAKEREQQFKKWYNDAIAYAKSEQFDLAKTAIDKAYSYYDLESENDVFFSVIADIYRLNRDYTSAIDHINNAIVLNQTDASYYILKAKIMYDRSCSPDEYNKQNDINSAVDTLNLAIVIAQNSNDRNSESEAYGLLAWIYYYSASEKQKSEELAQKSVEQGDAGRYGSQILNRLKEDRQAQIRQEEEQRQREEQYKREKAAQEAENEKKRRIAEESRAKEEQKKEIQNRINHISRIAEIFLVILMLSIFIFFPYELSRSSEYGNRFYLRDVQIYSYLYFLIVAITSITGSESDHPGIIKIAEIVYFPMFLFFAAIFGMSVFSWSFAKTQMITFLIVLVLFSIIGKIIGGKIKRLDR